MLEIRKKKKIMKTVKKKAKKTKNKKQTLWHEIEPNPSKDILRFEMHS
jgi:hypothetical protein